MFDLEKFKVGRYYVHLPTKEVHDEVMEFLDRHGFVWDWSRENLKTKTYWDKYKEKFAIICVDNSIKYGRKSYFLEESYNELKINKEENNMKLDKFIEKYGNVMVDEDELKELLGVNDEKYFIPKENVDYWFVGKYGRVIWKRHSNKQDDKEILVSNDVFATEQEALEHAKKKRFLLKMKRDFLDNSDKIDWKNDDQKKYYISYDHFNEKIMVYTNWTHQELGFFTTNREWLEQYLKEHEEEIKKYYFEVEEKEEEK